MDCTQTQSLLHGYIDQELDLTSSMALDRHLEGCPSCRAAFEAQSALRSSIRRYAQYHAAPAGLAERMHAELERAPRGAPARARTGGHWLALGGWRGLAAALASARNAEWLKLGTAVAATAVVTWTAAFQIAKPASEERITEQVITGHARSLITGHIADVASSDRHTVKPWLSAKLDFSPPVTDLTASGFPCVGGRLDYLNNRPVAVLVYRRRQHVINLFVWPDRQHPAAAPTRLRPRQGYHIVRWRDSGMAFWAISDLDESELKSFAERYASAVAPTVDPTASNRP